MGMKTDLFQSCGHCWVFQICWHIECSTFTASSFRIWNSSTGIPSPLLALLVVMLPKARLSLHFRMSDSRWVIIPSRLSGSWRSFLYCCSVYSCHLLTAGVQLQQPGIQPESVSSDGEKMRQPLISLGLPVYFKLMILFYTFTKALGQRLGIFSSHWPRFIFLQKSLLPLKRSSFLSDSLIYFFSCVLVNTL